MAKKYAHILRFAIFVLVCAISTNENPRTVRSWGFLCSNSPLELFDSLDVVSGLGIDDYNVTFLDE